MTASPAAKPDPESLYPAHVATLQQRAAAALEAAGFDGIVISAGELDYPARDDIAFPFRVEPHFAAWLPLLRHPGCALRIEPGRPPVLIYPQAEGFWHMPPRDPEGFWAEQFDIRVTRSAEEAQRALAANGARLASIGTRADTARDAAANGEANRKILKHLDFLRAFKTPYERACMRIANFTAARGHAALGADPRGWSEFALDQHYCRVTAQRESELPYPNIVAVNEHAAVLHYENLDLEAPGTTRSLLLDAGAACNGYAADVTRTWAQPGSRFAELAASMNGLQQQVCRLIVDGADFVAVNERTHELLAAVLAEHGLVTCSAAAAYDSGLTRVFLPHGLGHLLGLQVHDAGGHQVSPDGEERAPPAQHPFLRLTRRLSADMIVTVEPGLYFIDALLRNAPSKQRKQIDWTVVDALRPYGGIRVEDDVAVTRGGCTNLTREAFASVGLEDPQH